MRAESRRGVRARTSAGRIAPLRVPWGSVTKLRNLPWGPSLSSASGAPARLPRAVNAYELVPRTTVRLPSAVGDLVRVAAGGRTQLEGVDYFLVGRLLVFERMLIRESPLRYWRRVLSAWGMGAKRRDEPVDVWHETDAGVRILRDLDGRPYP